MAYARSGYAPDASTEKEGTLQQMADPGQMVGISIAIAMVLMIVSGTSKRMLAWKWTPRRRCDACRRDVRDCSCRH
jgi:hypothetical protein